MEARQRSAFLEDLAVGPAGAAGVLAVEMAARSDRGSRQAPLALGDSEHDHAQHVVDWVDRASLPSVKALFVRAASTLAGRWWGDSSSLLVEALRHTDTRASVRERIADRFGDELHSDVDTSSQYVWLTSGNLLPQGTPLGATVQPPVGWQTAPDGSVFTATGEAPEVSAAQVAAWDCFGAPVTCWHTACSSPRIFEVHSPADWEHLLTTYPFERTLRPNSSWEIPGPDQRGVGELLSVPGQCAVRNTMTAFVEPDWDSVKNDLDAVHLSWRGFLACEGRAIDLPQGRVGMLRGWGSERTLWLNPVLEAATPVHCDGLMFFEPGLEVGSPSPGSARCEADRLNLLAMGISVGADESDS